MNENQVYGKYTIVKYLLLGLIVHSTQTEYPKKESDFMPSIQTLVRILKTMTDKGPEAKTALSVDANLNYTRFTKHIV